MTTVYKYELHPGTTKLSLPTNAQVLSVACQGEGLFLWAWVAPRNPKESRTFEVYGTGHEIPNVEGEHKFIGTAQMHGGALIWHALELVK